MRRAVVMGFASLIAALTAHAAPGSALDRVAHPGVSASIVARVADLDRRAYARPQRRHGAVWRGHWRERAAYARWMHNEYVNAGYPVRHAYSRTYVVVDGCCCCDYDRRW